MPFDLDGVPGVFGFTRASCRTLGFTCAREARGPARIRFCGQPRVRCHHQVRKVVKQFGHAFREVNGGATPPLEGDGPPLPLQSGAPPPPPPPASVPLEDQHGCISTALSGMNPPGLMILRHAPEQCYQFGVSGSALRSFSWGIPSKASYCGDTENEAIDEAINWVASVVLEGEDGM